ncbi:MAG: hypothetical protein IKP30_04045 [Bacteroidaceae bacterium]|nr:hypothetical protein [Bacteroidaceae bacterium]MBR6276546.1 hypothetical protein [Prevotella sp.]
MKKLLFMFATAALVLSACSSEDDIVQNGGSPAQLGAAADAVGFDVYTQQSTNVTKAGLEGTMTTNRMQRSEANGGGFGVYAFLTEDTDPDAAVATGYQPGDGSTANVPNFMANEKILWNSTNLGWYYSPLKYWPNETNRDSQTTPAAMTGDGTNTHLDRLTFFAYAPYVATGAGTTGITAITDNGGLLSTVKVSDPTIAWTATANVADFNPNEGVDLLWGVAPSGGLSYTAVNGTTVTVPEGRPLIDMIKPNVNTSMKFLFNHALARFGVTVVAAVDQVAPGGKLDPNTKITVNTVKISGPFGTSGELNLNNGVHNNIANWTKSGATSIGDATTTIPDADITVDAQIAQNLKYAGVHTFGSYSPQSVVGVTTAKQDLLDPSTKWFNKLAAAPAYNPGKKYYTDEGTTEAHAKLANGSKAQIDGKWGFFYTESAGVYTKQSADDVTPAYPTLPSAVFYFVKVAKTYTINNADATTYPSASTQLYTIDAAANDGSDEAKAPTFATAGLASTHDFTDAGENGKVYYELEAVQVPYTDLPYAYDPAGTYYEAERNYLYVVPTNNVAAQNSGLTPGQETALRTIKVQIEYYITTEDAKIQGGRTQTKNVVTKEVVLPSLANGKSYNLNLVLGLTSVKIEAEVDDWKVVNSQVDLPQNTGE